VTTDDPILARVHALIDQVAGPGRRPDDAGLDTPLGDSGYGFDSLDLLEVILGCEREFGVAFDAGDDLAGDELLSARRLADLIRRRLAA
jgi:acyl carrier protein